MFFIFLNQWMPENFLKAVCWTLVHSIWQGVMIAILGGVIILTTKKATANLRYNLLVLLFGFYLFVVGLTFVKQLSYDYQGSFSSSASSSPKQRFQKTQQL